MGRPEVSSGTMPPTLPFSMPQRATSHASLQHGRCTRMLDASTDAAEIFAFVEMTDDPDLPRSAEAIDHLLVELHEAGLVAPRAGPSRAEARLSIYRSYALTPDGWARIGALENGAVD